MPSLEGENLVSERKDQSASRQTFSRCSAISPKVTDAEGKKQTIDENYQRADRRLDQ
ncbi:hypothetical protein MTR67_017997 [Solanum verrucosum]|uniref:Uncharacterized protein n=1 Tax=Solanum verrucosum TaxID=315347 RepID=A0AAF0QIY1_SOLVR|nr:hypothetical protein MTR67_017997 [Solanum verrucosum]